MHRLPSRLKFSIVEILTLLLVGGVGFATMRTGGMMASAALIVAMLLFIAMAIAAIVAEEELRNFAIGFVVAGVLYGGLVLYFGPNELDPDAASLPTTRALEPLRDAITTYTYTNVMTGETMNNDEALAAQEAAGRTGVLLNLSVTVTPPREQFVAVAHVLIGMLLGYAGGKFAQAIARRERPLNEAPRTGA